MTGIWFFALVIYAICVSPFVGKAKRLERQGKIKEKDALLRKMAANVVRRMFRLAGVKYEIEGYENIPKEGAILYTPNHQSIMDVAIMILMREPCGFVVKKEAKKIPIIRTWMSVLGCIYVERGNPRKAAAVIGKVCDRINEGRSFIIFPEGTRSKDGNVGEFKGGAFKIAEKTGVTIVPVAISGTSKIWEEHKRIRKSIVKVKILPPIETKDMSRKEVKALAPIIREDIVKSLES